MRKNIWQKLVLYKYLIAIFLILILINGSFLLGYWGHKKVDNNGSGSISEDILSIVNKTFNDSSVPTDQSCSICHNSNITYSGISRYACRSCHDSSHGLPSGDPSRYEDLGRHTVHDEHGGSIPNKGCQSCHGVPSCNRCHNGHNGIVEINISKNCISCHGELPEPKGHNEERTIFKDGSHKWMGRCNTCHYQNELKFKDIVNYNMNNSSQLCGNCHSEQYKDSSHYKVENGTEKQSCVSCHNPHSPGTAKFSLEGIKSATTFIIGNISNIIIYLREHSAFLALFILLGLSVVFEYIFRPKKGHVILSNHLRMEYEKSKAKIIKIYLSQSFDTKIMDQISNILNSNDAKIIGISAGNNDAIIFISRDYKNKNKDKSIITAIRSISGVTKAEYRKEYDS